MQLVPVELEPVTVFYSKNIILSDTLEFYATKMF